MKVISVTLSGNNQSIISDALKSVYDIVDKFLVVDTGITDQTLEVAKDVCGERLIIESFPWINDFAAARNFTLLSAHNHGGDWAIILDTDERIHQNNDDLRKLMSLTKENCISIMDVGKTYYKARCFRLPISSAFYGPTHEVYPAHSVGCHNAPNANFSELRKTAEQMQHKLKRDAEILEKHTKENAKDPRWFYYLGDTYNNLNKLDDAILAYESCHNLNGWDEESAWSMFKMAGCFIKKNEYQKALESCARGIGRHPGIAELYWLAGFCSYHLNMFDKAIIWSRQAINMGLDSGLGTSVYRIGFRHPAALHEGPYDIIRWSAKRLGKSELEEWALNNVNRLYKK